MAKISEGLSNTARVIISPVALLAIRVYLGYIFFQSGLSKTEDWPNTLLLFQDEWAVPLLSPLISAWLATAGEIIFSALIIIGLFTRFASSGLLIIVLVIEFVVFNGASGEREYYYWILMLATLVGYGGEKLSLDAFFSRNKARRFGG